MGRSRCSICDDDLSTDRLCSACAESPYNVDWVRESHRTVHAPLEHLSASIAQDMYTSPLPKLPPKAAAIVRILREPVVVRYRARGRARYRGDGYVTVTRAPHLSEIARHLGVSRKTVCVTLQAIQKLYTE